ncbi:MAG: DUF1573 domain-containing protein [Chloroflexota bacterium]
MRSAAVLISFIIFYGLCGCGSHPSDANLSEKVSDTGKAVLVFDEYEHHFGKVAEGEKISYQFRYENTGTAPLAIASVTTTCGCTVPKYNTRPVDPGGKGSLEVVFDTSGRNGTQTKTITVRSNASIPVILLRITAEVEQK